MRKRRFCRKPYGSEGKDDAGRPACPVSGNHGGSLDKPEYAHRKKQSRKAQAPPSVKGEALEIAQATGMTIPYYQLRQIQIPMVTFRSCFRMRVVEVASRI
jgi:hypothetical protein